MKKTSLLGLVVGLFFVGNIAAQGHTNQSKFRQLKEEWATPNMYRTGSGAPGPKYFQQKADYEIDVKIDTEAKKLYGQETITYTNNSPDALEYLWVQLDQNTRKKDARNKLASSSKLKDMSFADFDKMVNPFDGGFNIEHVKQGSRNLNYTIQWTMMRIKLDRPLRPGKSFTFNIKWNYNINDYIKDGGRSGYEPFEDGNDIFVMAQWFPRMAVYNDYMGWQNHQFWGRSEFALVFGDYEVNITVPDGFMVASTGELQNESSVLTSKQRAQLKKARRSYDKPVIIQPQAEVEKLIKLPLSKRTKTWTFEAENVRDFAFSMSRRFIWDAMAVKLGKRTVMAYSYYPPEGNPLWEQYSTRAVAHTLKVYSKHTFDYPYHKAISVHAKWQGMEYPMICWNYGRPEADGTYSKRVKYGMIGVIIHEVGHNFFPMIVNSDERQWTWMDEGLNTFLQFLTEQEMEENYPSRRGDADKIVRYMKVNQDNLAPIMSKGDDTYYFGPNAYGKPATGLNILRETILGRENFDFAFKTYAQRWKFKHPTPEDFFRTMEDASGIELDWFWRGWFYTTDYTDIGIKNVTEFKLAASKKDKNAFEKKQFWETEAKRITTINHKKDGTSYLENRDAKAKDFYNSFDPFATDAIDDKKHADMLSKLDDAEKTLLKNNHFFYQIEFEKPGGLIMPILLGVEFTDGTTDKIHIPAQIWRKHDDGVTKVLSFEKQVKQFVVDPNLETADVDLSNNFWPTRMQENRFQLFKKKKPTSRGGTHGENPMQRAQRVLDKATEKK